MRKRLQIALMASTIAATSLSLVVPVRAAEGVDGQSEKITATDEHGRRIYVNEPVSPQATHRTQSSETPRRKLMYWSSKDNRWKAVPPPNARSMQAARSAADEVNQYLGR